jgi:hypothetical protein
MLAMAAQDLQQPFISRQLTQIKPLLALSEIK